MNPAHMAHPTPAREQPSKVSQHPDVPYFPNGGVAAPPFMVVNPLSHSTGTAPGNGTPNEVVGPATADWIVLKQSDEQGVGVPPFKKWPRQFHTEAFNFDSIAVMPLPDQVGPVDPELINRPEKAGWSVPKFYEQYQQPIAAGGMGTGVANLKDPASVAYAVGWGYIG